MVVVPHSVLFVLHHGKTMSLGREGMWAGG
jgi:hypothetical protein